MVWQRVGGCLGTARWGALQAPKRYPAGCKHVRLKAPSACCAGCSVRCRVRAAASFETLGSRSSLHRCISCDLSYAMDKSCHSLQPGMGWHKPSRGARGRLPPRSIRHHVLKHTTNRLRLAWLRPQRHWAPGCNCLGAPASALTAQRLAQHS